MLRPRSSSPSLSERILAVVVALASMTAVAAAAPGDLDTTFGSGGTALVDLGGFEEALAVHLQPDGRILIGGDTDVTPSGVSDGVVARLLSPQGTLDPSFADGFGWSDLNFGVSDFVDDISQQADGRIVAVGTTGSGPGTTEGFVARVDTAGALDPSFGDGRGFDTPLLLPRQRFTSVVLQPDDRILVAGTGGTDPDDDMTVARMVGGGPAAGALDFGYGGGSGWSRLDFPNTPGAGRRDEAGALLLQPDGRIVVAGASSSQPGGFRFAAARLLNPQGTYDPSFGPDRNGTVTVDAGRPARAEGAALQPDGGIVLAGTTAVEPTTAILVRLLPSGALDPGFSGDGIVINPGSGDEFHAVAIQPDGKIVAAGETGSVNGKAMLVMRFQPNGQSDTTFGAGGRVTVGLGRYAFAYDLALQPDGRIVVVGEGGEDIAVVRLEGEAPAGPGGGAGAGPGGAATAAPLCAGRPATVIGSSGGDRLRGTPAADVIAGLAGNDVITGLGGADIVCGGAGNDRLTGGAGADRLLGQDGVNLLTGGAGRDVLAGGAGADRLLGGPGADRLLGGAGADRLLGGGGADALLGGAGRNIRVQ